jgi:hypothetical protein
MLRSGLRSHGQTAIPGRQADVIAPVHAQGSINNRWSASDFLTLSQTIHPIGWADFPDRRACGHVSCAAWRRGEETFGTVAPAIDPMAAPDSTSSS